MLSNHLVQVIPPLNDISDGMLSLKHTQRQNIRPSREGDPPDFP